MHKLEELKTMLCDELESYGSKGKLDVGSLEIVDKLAHAIKNIDKIIESKDGEYSGGMYVRGTNPYDNVSYEDRSYARGRGRNARRDSMGRYSGDGYSMAADDVVDELRDIMNKVKDDRTKNEIKQFIHRIEQM